MGATDWLREKVLGKETADAIRKRRVAEKSAGKTTEPEKSEGYFIEKDLGNGEIEYTFVEGKKP